MRLLFVALCSLTGATAPGHLFRANELQDAIGMLLQPMVFGWDAMFAPRWSYGLDEFFLHVSHDSFVSVVTRTKEFHTKAFGLLEELDFNPKLSAAHSRLSWASMGPPMRDFGLQARPSPGVTGSGQALP